MLSSLALSIGVPFDSYKMETSAATLPILRRSLVVFGARAEICAAPWQAQSRPLQKVQKRHQSLYYNSIQSILTNTGLIRIERDPESPKIQGEGNVTDHRCDSACVIRPTQHYSTISEQRPNDVLERSISADLVIVVTDLR